MSSLRVALAEVRKSLLGVLLGVSLKIVFNYFLMNQCVV